MKKVNLEDIKNLLPKFIVLNKLEEGYEIKESEIVVKTKHDLQKLIAFSMRKFGYDVDLNFINVSKITDFNYLFEEVVLINVNEREHAFIKLSLFNGWIDEWNTESAECMDGMFENSSFNRHKINFDVRKVKTMVRMFKNSYYDKGIDFIDAPNLRNVEQMFCDTTILNPVILNLARVEDVSDLFEGAKIKSVDLLKNINFNFQYKVDLREIFKQVEPVNKFENKDEFVDCLAELVKSKITIKGKNLTLKQQADCFLYDFQRNLFLNGDVEGFEVYFVKHFIRESFKNSYFLNRILKKEVDESLDNFDEEDKEILINDLISIRKENEVKRICILALFFKQVMVNQDKISLYFKEKYKDYFVYLGVDDFKSGEKSLVNGIKI